MGLETKRNRNKNFRVLFAVHNRTQVMGLKTKRNRNKNMECWWPYLSLRKSWRFFISTLVLFFRRFFGLRRKRQDLRVRYPCCSDTHPARTLSPKSFLIFRAYNTQDTTPPSDDFVPSCFLSTKGEDPHKNAERCAGVYLETHRRYIFYTKRDPPFPFVWVPACYGRAQ